MFLGACLPIRIPHLILPYPPPSTDSHIYTHSRPALGSRADVSLCLPARLPARSPRTNMCGHEQTLTPPTPLLPGWSQRTPGFPATIEAVSHPFFLLHSPDLPSLNTAGTSVFPCPLSCIPAQARLDLTGVLVFFVGGPYKRAGINS